MVYHDNNARREQELMDTIQASKGELQKDYTDQMSKLKSEVMAGQESSSQEVVKKLNKQNYQFKGKETKFSTHSTPQSRSTLTLQERRLES